MAKMTIKEAEKELNKIDELHESKKITKLQHNKKTHAVLLKLKGKK